LLDKTEILQTSTEDDWTVHDVMIDKENLIDVAKNLKSAPWYAHFWVPGDDTVAVVFKNKMFQIKHSDKQTWKEAIIHGKTLGIPEEQLDFFIKEN